MSLCIFLLRLRIVRTLPLFLALLTAAGAHAQSPIALVQHAGKDGGTTTTTSLEFPSPNTAGNWIAVCARGGFSSSQVFTVTDSNGNLYRRGAQIGFTGSAVTLAVFYAENIIGGANTITVSDTVSAPLRIAILEYSGVATSNSLDAATAGTGTSASPSTPSLTTTANGDLLLGSIATTNPASFTAQSSYTISDFVPAEPNTKLIDEEKIQAAAGTASAEASLAASDSWGAALVAIKAASTGTASAPPSITSLSPTSGSAGTSVTITGANFGSTQGTSAVNFNGAAATPSSWSDSTIVAPVPSGATTGNVVVTVGGVASNGVSFTVTITAVAPSITAQPSNQTVTAGQTATFSVTASGTAPLSYQWQKNGANISGATSSTYATPATTTSDSGSTFDVIVSNSAGSVTSNAATLTVNASAVAPAITTQPANQTVTAGQTATFSVTASGTAPLSYQWQKSGANISGATSSSYTTLATTTSDSGSTFDVIVSNSADSATSNGATLTVNASAVAPTISSEPANETVTTGQTATFTVTASGTAPLSYQWQKNGADISGATSSTYTTPATTTSDSGSTFDVVVSNSAGTASSNAATLTVNATTANSSGWTYVQDSIDTFCNAGASSCTIQTGTFLPTVSGSIWAVLLTTNNNVTIASVTGGGGTWTLCPNCHVFNSTLSRNEDIAYNLTGNPGTTSITVNLSGASSGQFGLNFVEVIPPPGSTASFDAAGTSATTSCTTCTGVGLNISATDVIIQSVAATSPSTWNAWSAPYITLPLGEGLNLNATSGAAPTVLTTGPGAVFSAIAFKSTAGSFAPPAQPISVVNYTAQQGINCSPSCSLSIPSTGSGHLLYIEAADLTSSRISSISGGGSWIVPSGSNTCQITLSGTDALSCGYVLSSTAGVTSLNVTMSGSTNASFAIWELASASGSFSFDVEGSATNNPSFDPSGAALALSGSNDVIFQSSFVPGGTSSVSFYPIPRVPPGGQGTMFLKNNAASVVLLNTTSGTTPLWVNQQNSATVVSAVAFSTP